MRVKWVLIGCGIVYVIAGLAFVPVGRMASPPVEEAWEIFSELVFTAITVISIGLLEGAALLEGPLARSGGIGPLSAPEVLLAVICIAVALVAAAQLARQALMPGWRGTYLFFLLLALTIVAMVRFTMYSWSHFA
jgi:hypothetical protein